MKLYRVLSLVAHDGTDYPAGADIELDETTAAPLLEGGAIDGPHLSLYDIGQAIRGLSADDPKLWTKDGRPQVRALTAALGGAVVTPAQRDAAWANVQSAKSAD